MSTTNKLGLSSPSSNSPIVSFLHQIDDEAVVSSHKRGGDQWTGECEGGGKN